jgi:hypothetical protein
LFTVQVLEWGVEMGWVSNWKKCLRDCAVRLVQLKVVSINRCVLQGEKPRFSSDFVHPFLCKRPFMFQRHLMQDFRNDKLISNFCTSLFVAAFLNLILIFPIFLTHCLEGYPDCGMIFVKFASH